MRSTHASTRKHQRPGRSTSNEPPRGRCRAARAAPRASASRPDACSGPPRRASRARRGRSGRHLDALADGALHRVAAAVDLRRDLLDLDPRRASSSGVTRAEVSLDDGRIKTWSSRVRPESSSIRRRFRPASSAARRTGSSTGSRRQGSRGGRCCRSGRRTSSARRTARRRRSPPRRRSSPARGAGHGRRDRGLRRAPSVLDRRLGALRRTRGARRPGALRAGVGGAARVRGRARHPADRRRADLRRPTTGADVPAGRSSSRTARSPARRRTRSARRASSGGTRSTTGPRTARPATAGGSSASGAPSSSSTSAASTTSAASSRTGRSRSGTRRRSAGAGGRGPGAELFRRRRARARRAAAHRRGPRAHHAAGLPAARRARPAGDGRAPVGVPPPPRNPHRLENHRRNSVVYTSTHDTDTAVGWFAGAQRAAASATASIPNEPSWGLIELAYSSRAALAIVPAQDVLGLGSEARMNRPGESRGNWSWQLARGVLTPALASRLRRLAEQHGRV